MSAFFFFIGVVLGFAAGFAVGRHHEAGLERERRSAIAVKAGQTRRANRMAA